MGRVLFVTGFKGGVGKTTVSANLAATLCAPGNRVLVIDGDFGMRCMDMVLGVENDILFDCSDILFGRCSATAAMCSVGNNSDFCFIPAPMNHSGEAIPKDAFSDMISDLREDFDFIIIDSCAEMTEYYKAFASVADEAVIVTLHQSTSVRAAEKTAIRLSAMGLKKLHLVVNGYRAEFAENGALPDIARIINRSSVRLLGVVPYGEGLQTSQEAAQLAFGGDRRKKAEPWEVAFRNISLRIRGERVNLFSGMNPLKKRSAYN